MDGVFMKLGIPHSSLTISIATLEDDLDRIADLCLSFLATLPHNDVLEISQDESFMRNVVEGFTLQPNDQSVIFLLKDEDDIVGILGAVVTPNHPFLSGMKGAQELAWYVDPEYRGLASTKLLDAYHEWANALGCSFATMSNLHDDNERVISTIYKRKGYTQVEQSYIKKLG